MADIFSSYSSKDRSRVELFVKALASQGWSIFWDRVIPVGKTWDEVRRANREREMFDGCMVEGIYKISLGTN